MPTTLLKLGPKGVCGSSRTQGIFSICKPAYKNMKPIDTTGAGDSFNVGFIYAFLSGMNLDKCLEYGNACRSISVTLIGGASSCATLDEVKELLKICNHF
ncbi:MAG: carbohydrate kinase family protein [Ignavibacteria bacterium]|nr:carbohydrate kinase family protein [Ignavibacteria bacterium]